ncbi:MAG: Gfo/Idh/MocA family oxidoreductase, partial [Verrucomicrobia bacterium]|nr:Gfo/Idh/MocA family oxidoreductase [Verrucomicrobiota bacterium]
MNTTNRFTRRQFLRTSTLAVSALTFLPRRLLAQAPSKTLNIACIGVGGRGDAHVWTSLKENLVAICDISQHTLDGWLKRIEKTYQKDNISKPPPKTFTDYRELFDKMGRDIDAVVVATPDHHHAPASMRAIKLGKHVYCEKPLTHNIHEARQLTLAARKKKVATQLGNQGRAEEAWRLLCEYLWAGIIGPVREVHIWTDRAGTPKRFWWPQGGTRPQGEDPVPAWLNW